MCTNNVNCKSISSLKHAERDLGSSLAPHVFPSPISANPRSSTQAPQKTNIIMKYYKEFYFNINHNYCC